MGKSEPGVLCPPRVGFECHPAQFLAASLGPRSECGGFVRGAGGGPVSDPWPL